MKEKDGKIGLGLITGLIIVIWSSCAVEHPFSGTSDILAHFGLKSTAAMDGKITIGETYLKLDRIEVTGSFGENNNPSAIHSIPPDEPPYKLTGSDSGHVSFTVRARAYDQLELHLFLQQEDYQLIFLGEPVDVEAPTPDSPESGENTPDENSDNDDGNADGEPQNDNDGETSNDGGSEEDKPAGDNTDDDKEDEEQDKDKDDDNDSDKPDDDDDDDDGHDKDDKGDKDDDKKEDKDKDKGDDDDDKDDDDEDDDDKHHHDDDGDDDRKSSNANNRTVDLDHFFQNARPGLVVFGIYENNGKVIHLIFAATDFEKISMRGRQNDNASILLDAQNTAQVTFDPERWFESLTPADIESGSMQTYQQQNVLFIHPDYNPKLYQSIVSKLEGSADLNISLPETAGHL